MKTQSLLAHHGIAANPFAEEDAQTDPVFKEHCIASTYHPTWDKIYGDPAEPATAIVFGEKGAGKTAMRLQIVRHLRQHNRTHPLARLFVIEYDDFNPFLDRFSDRAGSRRKPEKVLAEWKLWDHMDAILALGTTTLVDALLAVRQPSGVMADEIDPSAAGKLDQHQARDLLLLAACYDQSSAETIRGRWKHLAAALHYRYWLARWDLAIGGVVTVVALALLLFQLKWTWLEYPWVYLAVLAGWGAWLWRAGRRLWQARGIVRNVRAGRHDMNQLRQVLMNFSLAELAGQPLPNKRRTDDRFEMLAKLQGILRTLGFSGIIVLVDRVDEPHLINGSAELMRALVWPLLDNKLLKHTGVGFKLLLPIELSQFVDREGREFYQRARLDKQNMIPSLEWTGEALYDLAMARVRACAAPGKTPNLRDLFDPSVTDRRLMDAFRALRVPRHLFKFMYRLFVSHCNAYTDEAPNWKISSERFEATLAVYTRDQDAFDRGLKAG